jgi:hypothetical protein
MVHVSFGFTSQDQFAMFPICDMSICAVAQPESKDTNA